AQQDRARVERPLRDEIPLGAVAHRDLPLIWLSQQRGQLRANIAPGQCGGFGVPGYRRTLAETPDHLSERGQGAQDTRRSEEAAGGVIGVGYVYDAEPGAVEGVVRPRI